ncbi:MAG: DUF4954 family protein [Leptospirales bacterium]|nr:DUF4954 family protein [Leptospirales bacterium]
MINYNEIFSSILRESQLLEKIKKIKSLVTENSLSDKYRKLEIEEIDQLKKQNNHAESWDTIFVVKDFFTSFISNNRFYGTCYLGRFTGSPLEVENKITMQSGIYDSIIKNSIIEDESLICRCGLMANYLISSHSVIYNINTLTSNRENIFNSIDSIIIGPESGERSIKIFPDIDIDIAECLLTQDISLIYNQFLTEYKNYCSLYIGYIGENCRIINSSTIANSFIDNTTVVSGALSISDSIIFGSDDSITSIGSGVNITESIIQQGCTIDSIAVIHRSILMEYSSAEKQCFISESIIGSNSVVGGGEISSTIAGPFTGAHHQSLLIACIWPKGRGNIGYGANIGSNHTSRLPDQEILPGEGMFFGLGSSIKFPADYTLSPYTVISTGTTTLPQRVEFPFSLITGQNVHGGQNIHGRQDAAPTDTGHGRQDAARTGDSVPLAYNELIPAWMLSDNIYAIIRNEKKYKERNKSPKNSIDFNIFRPEIIDMMIDARSRLKNVSSIKDIYTEFDIDGVGKNYVTENNRIKGIENYTFYIQFYALKELSYRVDRILSEKSSIDNSIIDSSTIYKEDNNEQWSHALQTLYDEKLNDISLKDMSLKENMEKLLNMNELFLSSLFYSRDKDYVRGNKIISNYAKYHKPTDEDPLIVDIRKKIQIEQEWLKQIIGKM